MIPNLPKSSLPVKKVMTPPMLLTNDCNSVNLVAIPMIDSIDASSIVTPDDASPIAFIAPKNATPSCRNLSIEVPLPRKTLKISLRVVPTDRRAISPMTPSNVPTPLKASPLIPEALSHASLSLSMHTERLSAIVAKPSVTATPIPATKFPIIVPMLPAKRSRIGRPVSRNFSISGNEAISAPIPTASNPIAANRPTKEPTPIIAAGPPKPIIVRTPRSNVIAAIAVTRDRIFSFTPSMPSRAFKIYTNAPRGTIRARRNPTPMIALAPKFPMRVSGTSIIIKAAIAPVRAIIFSVDSSTPSRRHNIPTNAAIGTIGANKDKAPLRESPTFMPFIALIIRKNAIIMADNAATDDRALAISINDNATIEAVITPIAIAIIIIAPLTF